MGFTIHIKRAYEAASASDGTRFLVERLWPRGVKREDLPLSAWLKDVAPSTELRRWFNHDVTRWDQFRQRYIAELDANPTAWQPIVDAARHGPVTLVYSAHDEQHNSALVLQNHLAGRTRAPHRHTSAS